MYVTAWALFTRFCLLDLEGLRQRLALLALRSELWLGHQLQDFLVGFSLGLTLAEDRLKVTDLNQNLSYLRGLQSKLVHPSHYYEERSLPHCLARLRSQYLKPSSAFEISQNHSQKP